jgi:hypothetical protein
LEGQISALDSERNTLLSELTGSLEELEVAREDVKKFVQEASDTQSLYQHELMQHGKSMESLFATKEQVKGLPNPMGVNNHTEYALPGRKSIPKLKCESKTKVFA